MPATASSFPTALIAVPAEVRSLLPARPGLPGTPRPSAASVSAWVREVREAALVIAAGRIDLASVALAEGNLARSEVYASEARALFVLGTSS